MNYLDMMTKEFLEASGMGGDMMKSMMRGDVPQMPSPLDPGKLAQPQPMPGIGGPAMGGVGGPGGGVTQLQVSGGAAPQQAQIGSAAGGTEDLLNAQMAFNNTQSLRTKGLPGIGGALINMGEMGYDAAKSKGAREELAKQTGIATQRELEKKQKEQDERYATIQELAIARGASPEQADSLARAGAMNEDVHKKVMEQIGGEMFKDKTTEATRSREQRVQWADTDEGRKTLEGMSPAEKRIFLATGQQINKANINNINTPPPKDHIWKTDEDGNQFLEVIPGSPTAKKEEAEAMAMQNNWRRMTANADYMLEDARLAFESAGYDTAGLGSLLAVIPGTDAKDMESLLDTLRANIGFDRLQQMREASITGGALGNVSNREIELLYNSLAPLDQKQSPEQLRRSLTRVINVYERMSQMGRDPELREQLEGMDDKQYWEYWDSKGMGRNTTEDQRREALKNKYG